MIFCTRTSVGIAIGQHITHIVALSKKRGNIQRTLMAAIKHNNENCQLSDVLAYCRSRHAVMSIPANKIIQKKLIIKNQYSALQIENDLQQNMRRYLPEYNIGDFFDFSLKQNRELHLVLAKCHIITPLLAELKKFNINIKYLRISDEKQHFFSAHKLGLQAL